MNAQICSAQEMFFLAELLGADTLLGVEDPFVGWLADEIEETREQTLQALAERDLLEIQPNGDIVLDDEIATLVGVCALREASFVVTVTKSRGETQVYYLHIAQQLAVEQTALGAPPNTYQLTVLGDRDAVYERILHLFGLDEQVAAPSSGGQLLYSELVRAGEVADEVGTEAAQQILEKAGLPGETAIALAQALADPVINGSLVAIANHDAEWKVDGLGLLEGRNGLWQLRASTKGDENWVEVIPSDADEVRQAIRRIVEQMLSEEI